MFVSTRSSRFTMSSLIVGRAGSCEVALRRTMIRWFEHTQVYAPSRVMETCTLDWPRQEVALTARDGCRLCGWFFEAEKGSLRSDIVFLLLHGNAGNICHRVGFFL